MKKKLKKIIQKPLRFHHQDIHEELEMMKEMLAKILVKLDQIESDAKNLS